MSVPMLSLEEHPVDEVAEPVLVVSVRAGLVERASAVPSEQRLALLLKAYERNQVARCDCSLM